MPTDASEAGRASREEGLGEMLGGYLSGCRDGRCDSGAGGAQGLLWSASPIQPGKGKKKEKRMNSSTRERTLLQRARRSRQRLVIMSVLTVCLLLGAGAAPSFMHQAVWQAGTSGDIHIGSFQIAATEGDIHIGSLQVAATNGDIHIGG